MYDKHAEDFSRNSADYLRDYIMEDANLFLDSLSGKRILDLGSGPGRDSAYFLERGFEPFCLDFSSEMVRMCREKGLRAEIGDLENLSFNDESFDGVWAYTSLLHIPKKNFPRVLRNIGRILVNQGIFYLGMKEGDFEGWIESDKYPGMKRFFSLCQDDELREIVSTRFSIIHGSRIELRDAVFLNYLCIKK